MKQLQARGKDTTLSLTTLAFQVSDLDEQDLIELSMVFSTRQLPVTTANRADRKEMSQWLHLQEIDIREIDADVGLLIGSDVPRALEPTEIKSRNHREPYDTRTDLGWVVNGPRRTANLITADVKLSKQFEKYCNMSSTTHITIPMKPCLKKTRRPYRR